MNCLLETAERYRLWSASQWNYLYRSQEMNTKRQNERKEGKMDGEEQNSRLLTKSPSLCRELHPVPVSPAPPHSYGSKE